jgi:hypothetical protein
MVYFDWIIKHYEMKKYKTTQVENSKPGLTESADYEECTGPRGPGGYPPRDPSALVVSYWGGDKGVSDGSGGEKALQVSCKELGR